MTVKRGMIVGPSPKKKNKCWVCGHTLYKIVGPSPRLNFIHWKCFNCNYTCGRSPGDGE